MGTVAQISVNSAYQRSRGAEESKKNHEKNQFYTLLAIRCIVVVGISPRKMRPWCSALFELLAAVLRRWVGATCWRAVQGPQDAPALGNRERCAGDAGAGHGWAMHDKARQEGNAGQGRARARAHAARGPWLAGHARTPRQEPGGGGAGCVLVGDGGCRLGFLF